MNSAAASTNHPPHVRLAHDRVRRVRARLRRLQRRKKSNRVVRNK